MFFGYLNDRRYVALISKGRRFYVIPDVGERQNIKSEYHIYRTGKRNGNCLNLPKTRGLIGEDVNKVHFVDRESL